MKSTKELLLQIENYLQEGRIDLAKETFTQISAAEVPRNQFASFMNCSWRSGYSEMGLRLLNPLIKNTATKISEKEWGEYAMCLNSIGATTEAKNILNKKTKLESTYNLYMAFSHIYEWDYKEALSFLQLATEGEVGLSPYQREVVKINLLASYIAEGSLERARAVFEDLQSTLDTRYKRLQSNLSELQLQLLCGEKKYPEGLKYLNENFNNVLLTGPESVFFQKWKTIIEVESGVAPKEGLLRVRDRALEDRMWEVARDCETRYSFMTGNPIFIKRAFYSTPWRSYRNRILNKFGNVIDFKSAFDLWLYPSPSQVAPQFQINVADGILAGKKLKPASLSHRLLQALLSDLYRPHSIGGLFSKLFEGENFDIESSPNRVYRAISELRSFIEAAALPAEIRQLNSGYKLVPLEPISLLMPPALESRRAIIRLAPLRGVFLDCFTAKQVSSELGVSLKTAQRILNKAIEDQEVEKSQNGASVQYKWKT